MAWCLLVLCPDHTVVWAGLAFSGLIIVWMVALVRSAAGGADETASKLTPALGRVKVFERTMVCDSLFWDVATSLFESTPRKKVEQHAYASLFEKAMEGAGDACLPDIIFYLDEGPEVCFERQQERARECEKGLTTLGYLRKLDAVHRVMYGSDDDLKQNVKLMMQHVDFFTANAVTVRRQQYADLLKDRMVYDLDDFVHRMQCAVSAGESLRCAVVGNIAAGKSTLIQRLYEEFGGTMEQVQEPVGDWEPMIRFYNQQPSDGAFPFQACALLNRMLDVLKK